MGEELGNKKYMAIFQLIFAIVLGSILFPLGIFYILFILPFLNRGNKTNPFSYTLNLFISAYNVIMFYLHSIARGIDILGNVLVGDMIEIFVTKEQNTLFGKKEHTISQSFGYLVENNLLNEFGKKVVIIIDKIFGKNHCLNAYNYAVGTIK